ELRARYRFGKESIEYITDLLADNLRRKTNRNHPLSALQQVLIALRFYAIKSLCRLPYMISLFAFISGLFTNIVARWPGSTHDSFMFRSSNLCSYIEENHHSLDDGILLGDSGYALRPFMMTPYINPSTPAQVAYNDAHCKTRVIIEQTFGRWKRRFHVLHSEIRMAPEKVCIIIGACAVLHNIAIFLSEPMEDGDVGGEANED
ncbi:unnamed protein product, partial [Pocillopora meandrina]